ncbi:F-box domain-containing protein [Mycena venus]|uniref:F-box domain-containing protein n=1 Tax=Mycena venus TaxID=2733690 RepID=A0A8H6XME5_9AGAR|nr:F-box domain-containing protein [Mycena venus]
MRSDMEADRIRLRDIDAQILDLERSLSTLRAQRKVVHERLESYKYPVLTLPNEIVSEIFVHFLPIYPDPPPFFGSLSPTTLTHICRKWRDIAISTPTLWKAIKLSDTVTFEQQIQIYDYGSGGLTANLVHCHLHFWLYDNSEVFDPSNITLPCLESLTFNPLCDPVTESLNCFIVPALHTLEIPESLLDTKSIESLKSFIVKSGCSLQDVRITGARRVHKDSYRAVFPSIPNFSFPGLYIKEATDDEDSEDESNSDGDHGSE